MPAARILPILWSALSSSTVAVLIHKGFVIMGHLLIYTKEAKLIFAKKVISLTEISRKRMLTEKYHSLSSDGGATPENV
jgi:hypothetical protein